MSTSSRRGARPYRRKRSKPYCGTSTAYWDGRTAWPVCLGGYSPRPRSREVRVDGADALAAAHGAFESGNRSVPADHSVRQGLGGAGDPPDLRRASACPYGADVGAGALASTASSITGHVDFVSRSRSIPLLTACGSSLGRSYATNAYSVATPRGRVDVAH